MAKIEQFTESLTQNLMGFTIGENNFGYVYPQGNVDNISKIDKLLKKAGGKPTDAQISDYLQGGKGKGKPEFIITFNKDISTILVIECKKTTSKHKSKELNKPNAYAIDGVLHYAKFLKDEYNVIAIGISGTDKNRALLDVYYWARQQELPLLQKKLHNIFLTPENYLKAIKGEKISKSYSLDEIRETAIEFHDKLRQIKVTERQKPVFIAGILIALENEDFVREYTNYTSFKSVVNNLNSSIEEVLDNSDIRKDKIANIKNHFTSIGNNEKLKNIPLYDDNSIIWYIEQLEMKIKPMMNYANSSLDALGVFYHEFVKYSGGDGSGLGIVLTPQHLTEFMCELANVDINSKIVDICCGSSSFLVTAMNQMFKQTSDEAILNRIKKSQLYGIELDQDLYVLSIANMIIRKDGKSNIIHGDCFNDKSIKYLKDNSGKGLNVGLLNPPYSQKDKEELEFVEQLLSLLEQGGIGVVVVPMSCAIGTKFKQTRQRLFSKHTLKAVFTMPDDIFYPTGTNVCVMVWEAHKKHKMDVKTFFGYCKHDGFIKRKKLGRIDAYGKWDSIKRDWLQLYRNSEIKDGLSAKECVSANDEWLCEAYMKTDYSHLEKSSFEFKIREYIAYLVMNGLTKLEKNSFSKDKKSDILDINKWQYFSLSTLFEPTRGTRLKKEDRVLGNIPLVTAGEGNLGVKGFIGNANQKIFSNCITIDMFCNSYAHTDKFSCDDNILALQSKKEINVYQMLFVSTLIEQDKYRYQYGRQYRIKNFLKHSIKLPTKDFKNPDWDFMESYMKQLPYGNLL